MMKSYALLMGSSATGKGTRLENYINFLTSKFGKPNILQALTDDGKVFQYGIEFPSLDMVVLGKLVTSNKSGAIGWSSLDMINASLGGTESTCNFVNKYCQNKHVIGEGEPMLQSNRYRPTWMKEFYGVEKTFHMIFFYRNKEDYIARIVGRSGRPPNGDAGWSRNNSYIGYINKCTAENFVDGVDYVSEHEYDAPVDLFGIEHLKFIGLPDLIQEFREYVSNNLYLKSETIKAQDDGIF